MKAILFNVIILFSFLLFISCDDNDNERIYFTADNIELTDIGRNYYDFQFDIEKNNDLFNCNLRTLNIKKNDTIKSIEAYTEGKKLFLNIISSPYDFDCSDESCFTAHNLSFNLINFKKGKYNFTIYVNNIQQKSSFDYIIE